MNTRRYGEKVGIEIQAVQNFWAKRAQASDGLASTILGNIAGRDLSKEKNDRAKTIFRECCGNLKQLKVVEFGCGLARWADNLRDVLTSYTGLDFVSSYIQRNQERLMDKKYKFLCASLTELPVQELTTGGPYDVGICTGCLMYINDEDLQKVFSAWNELPMSRLYLMETVSTLSDRLTLVDFFSTELQQNYSAIYRTSAEYDALFASGLWGFQCYRKGWVYTMGTGARAETNGYYWYFSRTGF